jgi:xylitol oxidase
VESIPSAGSEVHAEYFVDRRNAVDAILAVERLKETIKPLLMISELRTVAADNLWMSPCYHQPSLGLHFTWENKEPAVMQVLPLIERELAPFQPRPHWGKLFALAPSEIHSRYERLDEFRALLAKDDPKGKFRNSFLNRNIYGLTAS